MTKTQELAKLGQSIWYDNISRALLNSGGFQALVDAGILGVTSNPTIFEKSIVGSGDYDADIRRLALTRQPLSAIYEALVVDDIRRAADLLAPIYEETHGVDGYISLEVSPDLAHHTERTVREARHLFKTVGRPNLMIKVPATAEGIPAIQQLISEGININVTLIFSLESYAAVIGAYLAGLEALLQAGGDLARVASVASFFVSRVDSAVDKLLAEKGNTTLQGKAAVANARLAYELFRREFSGERWQRLATRGARVQRPLWASTSTKNPAYPDLLYVESLIAPDTVNTVPPQTLLAIDDHAVVQPTLEAGIAEAHTHMARLAEAGIDFEQVTQRLLDEGVESFATSFRELLQSIARKRNRIVAETQGRKAELGTYQAAVDAALRAMDENDIPARLWLKDYTVWRNDPNEIANRLGWLDSPISMLKHLESIHDLVEEVLADGYHKALVLGMGGSSLAPELFARTFGRSTAYMDLGVLDTTDPDAVREYARQFEPAHTLYLVSSKSGGTVETASFFKYLYNLTVEAVGAEKAGQHFVAITDPGSSLVELARQHHFRAVFLNDSNIGGRYSALTFFGLVPAALDGTDVHRLLVRAQHMAELCGPSVAAVDNPGAWLGAILAELAKAGRDKVTLVIPPALASFGDWLEQLIAESTGKEGKGILPVVGETLMAAQQYGDDRLFVYLMLAGDSSQEAAVNDLEEEGFPVVRLRLADKYHLGAQFFLWEYAIAVAGHLLGIQPFDQPNVESAKVLARKALAAYAETGTLPAQAPALTDGPISVYGVVLASTAGEALQKFLEAAQPGDYLALQAYVPPTPETTALLERLRERLGLRTRLATTVGYGPRFLHSTGQLHKGDRGNGLFVVFTNDPAEDLPIPDEAGKPESRVSFGVLKMAQAFGDQQALLENGRRVLRFHLGQDVNAGLRQLLQAL